jgi:hypothetical protein
MPDRQIPPIWIKVSVNSARNRLPTPAMEAQIYLLGRLERLCLRYPPTKRIHQRLDLEPFLSRTLVDVEQAECDRANRPDQRRASAHGLRRFHTPAGCVSVRNRAGG